MKKNYAPLFYVFNFFWAFMLLMLTGNKSIAQQEIGAHPNVDAGFENQSSGNLGNTQSATAWTYVSSGSSQSRAITTPGGNGGPKFLSVGRGNTTSNSSTSVNSNQVTNGNFLANTNYIVQFHYRQSAGFTGKPDTASFVFISSDGTSANRKSTKINLGVPSPNWTSFSAIVTTDATTQAATGTCGINIKNESGAAVPTTIDVDNFVVYPADNQTTPAADLTAPSPATALTGSGNPAVVDLSWTASATGVDGGGYMVVRFTADPTAEPAPIQNAVYKASATNTIGATGTVVYVGTATSFSDGAANTGTNYWYRVYSVDKAFNYSTAAVAGPFSPLAKTNYYYDGTGATDVLTNWWTSKNGIGSNPSNFTDDGQIFRIVTSADLTATLAISGIGSSLIIGEPSPGVPAFTVSFNSATLPGIDTLYQSSDGNPMVLNFNTSSVPSINQLFDIFTQVHYRAAGISVGTSKVYDKIFVENNSDVIFTGSPTVTTSFLVEAGSAATMGLLSSRYLIANTGATVTINGKFTTAKVAGLVSSNVGTPANTFGAIQFIGAGDVVLGSTSTIDYAGISSGTTQNITPRTDYANMIISGIGTSKTFTGPTTLSGSLTLNTTGTTGGIVSGGVLKVNGDLILTTGLLNTDAVNILELGATSNVIGGSNASHVSGPMRRNSDGTATLIFPVGKGGVYGEAGVKPSTGAASVYKAEYFNIPYSTLTFTTPLTGVSNSGYWDIAKVNGSADAAVSLSLNGTAITGATTTDELVVARFSPSSWTSESVIPINPGDATSGTAVSGVLINFGAFTFGIKTTSIFPLSLLSFNGTLREGLVRLNWSTTGEKNVKSYVVESSFDGRLFNKIETVQPHNTGDLRSYSYQSSESLKANTYFRIKIVNLDGSVQYSSIVLVKNSVKGNLLVLNNPVQSNTLRTQISNLPKGNYELQLTDMNGKTVQTISFSYNGDAVFENITLNPSLPKGEYVLKLSGKDVSAHSKIILQ